LRGRRPRRLCPKGEGVDKDEQRGFTYLKKACQGEVPEACSNLAGLQLFGTSTKSLVDGLASLGSACLLKHGESCFLLGSISEGLIRVEGVEPDVETAKRYYKKACEAGLELGCESAK
jgi:TPR repeat protein